MIISPGQPIVVANYGVFYCIKEFDESLLDNGIVFLTLSRFIKPTIPFYVAHIPGLPIYNLVKKKQSLLDRVKRLFSCRENETGRI